MGRWVQGLSHPAREYHWLVHGCSGLFWASMVMHVINALLNRATIISDDGHLSFLAQAAVANFVQQAR